MKNKTTILSGGLLGVLFLAGSAQAETKMLVQTDSAEIDAHSMGTPTLQGLQFAPFLASKGTLSSVVISVEFDLSGSWSVENTAKEQRDEQFGGGARVLLRTGEFRELTHFLAGSRHKTTLSPFDNLLDGQGPSATGDSFARNEVIEIVAPGSPFWEMPGGPDLELVLDGRVSLPGADLAPFVSSLAKVNVTITYFYEAAKTSVKVGDDPQALLCGDPVHAWREEAPDFLA